MTQQRGDLAIAIASLLAGEFDGIGGQLFLVLALLGLFALASDAGRAPRLAGHIRPAFSSLAPFTRFLAC